MFIIIGMGDDPLLCCARCGETVLRLRPTGEKMGTKGGEGQTQLDIFDQIHQD